jgi:fengycin family lipopeptide synthetase D
MLLTTKEFEEAKKYWMNKLSGELTEIRLVGDFPNTRQYKPAHFTMTFSSDLAEKIMRITKHNDLSLVVMVLASFKILLYRYTGQRDIVVSTPIFNKLSQEYNKWILLRDIIDSQAAFKDLLIEVKQTVSDAYKNQHYPFRRLIEHLNIGNVFSLFRVVLLLENIQEKAFISDIIDEFQNDIMVIFARNEDRSRLQCNIRYNAALFKEETIRSLVDHYVSIVTRVLNHLDIKIRDIDSLLEDDP